MRIPALLLYALVALTPVAASPPPAAPYHSLAVEFERFYDETAAMPEAERVALFRQRFDALFPGFYEPADGQTDAQFNIRIAKAFAAFPALREKYQATERDFPRVYAAGIAHFRAQFPGFKPVLPVWFIHSLGRMDGGTRIVRGKEYMVFGADVIASIHDARDTGPFLDHELFHVENAQWFKGCEQLWCSLWKEGAATYAASVMNPGADDHQLMLDQPRPIRAAVDADWRGALCQTRADLEATDQKTYATYLFGGDRQQKFPSRWGYYVGYRLMQRLGKTMSLSQIDHLDNKSAKPLVAHELDAMIAEAGGCPS